MIVVKRKKAVALVVIVIVPVMIIIKSIKDSRQTMQHSWNINPEYSKIYATIFQYVLIIISVIK
jgi:hypothetical protein